MEKTENERKEKSTFNFVPARGEIKNSKKKSKKIQKNKKYNYVIISSRNRLEQAEKDRK